MCRQGWECQRRNASVRGLHLLAFQATGSNYHPKPHPRFPLPSSRITTLQSVSHKGHLCFTYLPVINLWRLGEVSGQKQASKKMEDHAQENRGWAVLRSQWATVSMQEDAGSCSEEQEDAGSCSGKQEDAGSCSGEQRADSVDHILSANK